MHVQIYTKAYTIHARRRYVELAGSAKPIESKYVGIQKLIQST